MGVEGANHGDPDRAAQLADILPRTSPERGRSPFARVAPNRDGEPDPVPPEPERRGLLSRIYHREL